MKYFNQCPVGIEKVLTPSEFTLFYTMFNQWRLMKNKDNGYYFRSFEDLSNDCPLSIGSIKAIVKGFKNKGILECIAGCKKKGHANEYRFNMEVVFSFIDSNSVKSTNFELIEDGNGDELKVQKMSNKSTNFEHHKELTKRNNILCKIDDHMDLSSIPENNLFLNILENNTKYMKDDNISRPDVNVVANNVNNGMNDNTKNNNIQPLQDRTSDALDTPTVSLSGNEGIVSTHPTSEDNTIPTVNGTETLQHPAYSSAKPSKICVKKGAAAVGGGDFGAAQKSCETASNTPTVEQLPTSTEKVDNIAPLDSDTASNGEFDMYYAQYGCTREEYEEIQRSFHKSNWRSLPCKFKGDTIPLSKALSKLNEENKEGKKPLEANTYFFIVDRLNACANRHIKEGNMNETEFQDFQNAIEFESRRFFAYWVKTFENRRPYEARPSEKKMYDLLLQKGRIGEKQLEKTDITSIPTVNTVDTDFENEMAYLDFESGTMTKKRPTTA